MEFEWSDAKSDACFEERGFDFAYAARCFLDSQRSISPDHRFDYSEDRFQVLGCVGARIFFVAYTLRAGVIQIISARKANQREVTRYEDHTSQG
jgi:uncharacterized protein